MLPDENKHPSWHKNALRLLAAAGSSVVYGGIFCYLLVFSASQALLAGTSSSPATLATASLLTSQPQVSHTSHQDLHCDLWHPSVQSEWFFEIEESKENEESKLKKSHHQHPVNSAFGPISPKKILTLLPVLLQQSARLYAPSGRQRLQRYHAWKSYL